MSVNPLSIKASVPETELTQIKKADLHTTAENHIPPTPATHSLEVLEKWTSFSSVDNTISQLVNKNTLHSENLFNKIFGYSCDKLPFIGVVISTLMGGAVCTCLALFEWPIREIGRLGTGDQLRTHLEEARKKMLGFVSCNVSTFLPSDLQHFDLKENYKKGLEEKSSDIEIGDYKFSNISYDGGLFVFDVEKISSNSTTTSKSEIETTKVEMTGYFNRIAGYSENVVTKDNLPEILMSALATNTTKFL